ncbi:MAG: RluA family pseudouridine synthase [Myxococcota bacterium]
MNDPNSPHIIGEIDGIWAIYKPAGLTVHPTAEKLPHLIKWLDKADVSPGVRPIHRLDRGTSGVILCSASASVREQVSGWFQNDRVHKTYRALVVGRTRKKGVVRRKLQMPGKKPAVDAVTRWRRLEWLGPATLVEARPETGRKHQIRRHLSGVGFPIVGDTRYGPKRFKPIPGYPGRMWLHALRIELPGDVTFEAELPVDLVEHLAVLRAVEAKRTQAGKTDAPPTGETAPTDQD